MPPLDTELVTDENYHIQRYLLANPDLHDPYRDGLDPRAHFELHGRTEGRRQYRADGWVPPERRSPGVTLCAIARNEGPYLIEWLAYHRLLGFEHIVVYDNESNDGSSAMLGRLAAAGIIIHRPWPDIPGQTAQIGAYTDAVLRCATRWIEFLDLDEFLNLKQDGSIGDFLARFDADVTAIGLNWRIFGSAGRTDPGQEPVVARFTRAAPRDHRLNRYIKTIAVSAEIYKLRVHRVRLMKGRYADASGALLDPGHGSAPVHHGHVQINHYAVKSRDEFARKCARGSATRVPGDPTKFTHRNDSFFADYDRNEEIDISVLRRAPALIAEMERIAGLADVPMPILQASK